jgi:branched-chain amino acid transport system ATP-binding protein
MLAVADIVKSFGGNRAVDGVSFAVEAGTITGLIGPNGAGKTTLFNVIAGTLAPTSGSVTLDGVAIGGRRPDQVFAAGLARTFQIPRPFPETSVLENVMLAPGGQIGERFWANWFAPGRVAAQERETRERARHWIDFVGLTRLENEPARVLSNSSSSPACSWRNRRSCCWTSPARASRQASSPPSSRRSRP